jgi:AraC-like DNA-binding protein
MKASLLSERSRVFIETDPYTVSDYVNQHVGNHCILTPKVSQPLASLGHRKFACLDLCRISYGESVQVVSSALTSIFHLQLLLRGHCLWRSRGKEHCFIPGELLLINPDDPVDLIYSADCEKFIIKIPENFLQTVCQEHRWLYPEPGVRFLKNHYQLNELEGFLNLLAIVCQEAEAIDQQLMVQEHYAQIIASKMLSLMENNVKRVVLGSSSVAFDLISEHIDNNLNRDISCEELAKLTQMSERSLYGLFERNVRTTPQQYIRQKKLERINCCLRDPECYVRNLTELAMDFGFMHLGRFSEHYRKQFGELPSDTLKRR